MRSPFAVVSSIALVLLGACADSPLPERLLAPDKPSNAILSLQPQWTVTRLNFSPRGINDAGVIVGSFAGEAVRWQDGVTKYLPHITSLGATYSARSVTPLGKILGTGGGRVLVWSDLDQPAQEVSNQLYFPVAMTDDGFIIANTTATILAGNVALMYKHGAWVTPTQVGSFSNRFTGMNGRGEIVGNVALTGNSYAARWDSTGQPVLLPQFGGSSSGLAINSEGDVLGTSPLGVTVWNMDYTFPTLGGFPPGSIIVGWNNAGRVVGNEAGVNGRAFTYFGGTVTYLPALEAATPTVTGVNSCGWIIGIGAGDYGFLWKRTGLRSVCDVATPLLSQ